MLEACHALYGLMAGKRLLGYYWVATGLGWAGVWLGGAKGMGTIATWRVSGDHARGNQARLTQGD